jgi:hypothetical protein
MKAAPKPRIFQENKVCLCHLTHKSATSAKICVKKANLAKICVKLLLKNGKKVVEYTGKCPPLLAENVTKSKGWPFCHA